MLKPSTPTLSADDELMEYFPHLLLVHTKMSPSDFNPAYVSLMQVVLTVFLQLNNLDT